MYMLIPMNLIILANYVYVDSTGFWMLVNYVYADPIGFYNTWKYVYVDSTGFLNSCKLCTCWYQWIL